MAEDPWADPETQEWLASTAAKLPQMIRDSAVSVSLVPDDARQSDIKFAVELGLTIMLDKPILAIVKPGTRVPDHLVRVADRIVECDLSIEADREGLAATISEFMKDFGPKDD